MTTEKYSILWVFLAIENRVVYLNERKTVYITARKLTKLTLFVLDMPFSFLSPHCLISDSFMCTFDILKYSLALINTVPGKMINPSTEAIRIS